MKQSKLLSKRSIAAFSIIPAFAFALSLANIVHAADPYITLNNYSGKAGDTFMVQGWSFMPNEDIQLSFDGMNMTSKANNDGYFSSTNFTVPYATEGKQMVSARGAMSGVTKQAEYTIVGFYPKANATKYYVLPGQWIGFSANNFAPNETVSVYGPDGWIKDYTADGSGSFYADNTYMIPYSYMNSNKDFYLMGKTSMSRVDIKNINIGMYYPGMEPSTYYVGKNMNMSVNGSGFGPGETIHMTAGDKSMDMTADDSGNVHFMFLTPMSGGSFDLILHGVWSNTTVTRTITLAQ